MSTLGIVVLVILVLLLLGSIPAWPYSTGWGYGPVGIRAPDRLHYSLAAGGVLGHSDNALDLGGERSGWATGRQCGRVSLKKIT